MSQIHLPCSHSSPLLQHTPVLPQILHVPIKQLESALSHIFSLHIEHVFRHSLQHALPQLLHDIKCVSKHMFAPHLAHCSISSMLQCLHLAIRIHIIILHIKTVISKQAIKHILRVQNLHVSCHTCEHSQDLCSS